MLQGNVHGTNALRFNAYLWASSLCHRFMRLLLISNSTNSGENYLQYALPAIADFTGNKSLKAVFIPFAAVTFSFDAYAQKLKEALGPLGLEIDPLHRYDDPAAALQLADCIIVGGGNTFQLLNLLQVNALTEVITRRVKQGVPYIGWSAGSNIACPTICTTNDMPIVEPESLKALNLVPFQINPHYLDAHPEGHAGETREMRLLEYIEVNPDRYVVGLREGTMLRIENMKISLIGNRKARIFRNGLQTMELGRKDDLGFLWE